MTIRDPQQIRDWQHRQLSGALARPLMYGQGREYETVVRMLMQALAFVEEREDELAARFEEIRLRKLFSPLGHWGPSSR
ncbi:MAG: hypothetical protein U0821_17200 [Chloroflexota bacterium]